MMINNLLLGVGAMKSATTWVFRILSENPDIYFSPEKEIHYFAHINRVQDPLNLTQRYLRFKNAIQRTNPQKVDGLELRSKILWYANYLSDPIDDIWYLNLFPHRGVQKYCADFSNLYCHLDDEGWQNVRRIAHNLKVIYIMRDPWRRLWSHIRFHAAIVGRFDDLKCWGAEEISAFAKKDYIWMNTRFSKCVESLKKNLSRSELRIYFYEDIHEECSSWLGELENFLEIPHRVYSNEILFTNVNVTDALPMPEFFYELFQKEFEREIDRLEKLGMTVPNSWGRI